MTTLLNYIFLNRNLSQTLEQIDFTKFKCELNFYGMKMWCIFQLAYLNLASKKVNNKNHPTSHDLQTVKCMCISLDAWMFKDKGSFALLILLKH